VKTVSEILSAAADLIEPEGAWTKGQFSRDKEGFYSATSGRKAVCWCALGAIKRTAPDTEAAMAARDCLKSITSSVSVADWNDAPERTQAEVVAKLREAAERAREQGL
jgi:hypothetical protein